MNHDETKEGSFGSSFLIYILFSKKTQIDGKIFVKEEDGDVLLMKTNGKLQIMLLVIMMFLLGCQNQAAEMSGTSSQEVVKTEDTQENDITSTEVVDIVLSDAGITVDGQAVSKDTSEAVHIGDDIIYYEEGKGELYGAGSTEDTHSQEEADKHTVVTITKPGTYAVSGSLSYGQIVVDLGKDAQEDPEAVVNLVLNHVEITCEVAPAILVWNAYECGDDEEDNATPVVDTKEAGFQLILAENSENIVNGSYVAKIYKDGTTKEDIENDKAKKKYKFDGAIDSQISFNIDAKENGTLTVNAENEGISSALHLTINGGKIIINSGDDAINTSEDHVSVLTINAGTVTCDSGLGDEGDGIDSNGYIVINGGNVTACANPDSMDSGVDADLGIYINGGTLFACGNMYDEISKESKQSFEVFRFGQKMTEEDLILVVNDKEEPLAAFRGINDYTVAVYSSPELTEDTYHLYQVSSVTGELNGNIYTNITEYTDAECLDFAGDFMQKGPGMEGDRPPMMDGDRPPMPEVGR